MTCKVRRDFKIITDVLSHVSLATSNIRASSICSPKSLYKKRSNEILTELKAVVKTGALKVPEDPIQSATTYLLWQACVKQPALTYTRWPPRGREKKHATKMNFSSCSDHSWIKTTVIFSSLTYFFFCGLLSLQHKTMVLWFSITSDLFSLFRILFQSHQNSLLVCYLINLTIELSVLFFLSPFLFRTFGGVWGSPVCFLIVWFLYLMAYQTL